MSAPPLDGFDAFPFAHDGATRTVYTRGSGPGVVVMHEIPGITPQVAEFARRVAADGFRVYLPHLFGVPAKPISTPYLLGQMMRACISREFRCFAQHESSPITRWLRGLCAARIRPRCPGPGIGAIGMCFSGSFVLSLFVDDQLLAPVLCQPGLPFPSLKPGAGAALGVSPEDLKEALASPAPILGFRFEGDRIAEHWGVFDVAKIPDLLAAAPGMRGGWASMWRY